MREILRRGPDRVGDHCRQSLGGVAVMNGAFVTQVGGASRGERGILARIEREPDDVQPGCAAERDESIVRRGDPAQTPVSARGNEDEDPLSLRIAVELPGERGGLGIQLRHGAARRFGARDHRDDAEHGARGADAAKDAAHAADTGKSAMTMPKRKSQETDHAGSI